MDSVNEKMSAGFGEPVSEESAGADGERKLGRALAVPAMLLLSTFIMALAWLGHLNFKDELDILAATAAAWLMVLPEYALNIKALRLGYGIYSAAQMAAFRLCSGVVWVALVSRYVLGEELTPKKVVGFAMMFVAMLLIAKQREPQMEGLENVERSK